MNTLEYISNKFGVDLNQKSPISIPNTNQELMAQTFAELGFTKGVEVGVAQGHHAELLCKNIPGLQLYCVDIWEPYDGYNEYRKRIRNYYRQAIERLEPYNCVLIKKFSMDAVKDFENGSLDFAFIDGAHDFKNVAMDICEWVKKVRHDGIIYGHDYKRSNNAKFLYHVVDVVNAYTYALNIRPWFTLGERGKPDGMYREGCRNWMWIC